MLKLSLLILNIKIIKKLLSYLDKDEKLGKGRLNRNDVIITTRGTVGNIAQYDRKVLFDFVRINSGMAIIRNQEKRLNSEIIVVDDCSTDKTLEIITTFQNVKLIKLESNKGAGNARNKGAEKAIFENLCFVDSDINISEESILNLVKRLKKTVKSTQMMVTVTVINLHLLKHCRTRPVNQNLENKKSKMILIYGYKI